MIYKNKDINWDRKCEFHTKHSFFMVLLTVDSFLLTQLEVDLKLNSIFLFL